MFIFKKLYLNKILFSKLLKGEKLLVHICCSVDSHYFIKRLKEDFNDEKIIGYFYDPNIHPYSEYLLRYQDVKRSCEKFGVELILGDYDYESWLVGTKGLEDEPEKGKRCAYCFDFRFLNSVKKAYEIGEKKITSTLLMSPKKDLEQLKNSLNEVCVPYGLEVIVPDFRKNGGTNEQFALAKKDRLYHQNYCGCIFGLSKQKKESLIYELMSPITNQILPASIEEKLEIYTKVHELEQKDRSFEILKIKFLNYRLLRAFIKIDETVVNSYFLFNSIFKREINKFTINLTSKLFATQKDGIFILDLEKFNELNNSNFKSVRELNFAKMSIEDELQVRDRICGINSLNPIIVIDRVLEGKIFIYADCRSFIDFKEKLVIF